MPMNIAEVVRDMAKDQHVGKRTAAFECNTGMDTVKTTTYEELWEKAMNLARGIRERLGIREGTYQGLIAACYMDRTIDWYVVYIACAALGLPLAAMGTDLPSKAQQEARNTYIMEELKPVIVIADRAVDGDWVTVEGLIELGRGKGDFTIPRGRDLILGLHFTGGTTTMNYSKCVIITHGMVLHELVHYKNTVLNFIPTDKSVCVVHNGLVHWSSAAYGILSIGLSMGAMVALPGSDYNLQKDLATFIEIASSVHARLTKRRRTLVCGFVPTVLSTIRKECVVERARLGGDNDMVLISWGEKLSQELADEWNDAKEITLLDLLIASEYWLSFYATRDRQCHYENARYRVTEGAIIDVDEVLTRGQDQALVGELLLGGDMVTPYGYYVPKGGDSRAERNNAEKFVVRSGIRFYRTNDLVRVHPDKTVEFIGRIGNYVKLGGAFHDINVIQGQLSEELERSCYVVNYEGQLHLFITHRDGCDRINGSRLLAAVRSRIPMMDVENVHMLPANYELPRSEATGKLSGPMLVNAVTKADNRKAIEKKAEDTMEDVEAERMRGTALMITLALPLWSLLSHPFIILKAFFMRLMLLPWVMRLLIHPAGEYVAYYTPFGRYGVGFVLAQLPGALGWYVYILAAIMGAFLAGKRKPIRALCWVPVSLIVQGPAMLRQDVETWIGYVTKWGLAGVSKWYVEQLEKLCNRKYYWRCSRLLHRVNSLLAVSGGPAETTTTRWTPQEYGKCSRCRRRYALNYGCSDTFYAEPWNWYCEDCWWTHIGRINESFGMDVVEPASIGRLVGGHSSSSTCGSDTPSRGETSPSSGSTDNVVLFDSRGNSVEQKVLRILTAILGEPPTSETTLMGLSSLNVVLLTAQVNKEFGANLSVAEVMDSGTSLQVLCKRIEMAVIAAQPDDTTPPPHLVPAGGEEYAVYTNESLWTAAVCDWLLAASTPLETTRVQSAVGAIVKKHPSLRSYPADKQMDETISVLTKASAYFHLRGWGKESKFGTLLSWCVCELWPRIAVKADDEGPRVIECTYDMSEAKDVVRCTDRLWREYPFEPPFQVFLLRPASGEGANYLYIKTTHLLSDGYCVLPLVMDFERFINEPEESPVELNPYCILQKRLRDTIEMKPGIASGYNFEQQMEKWQSWDRGTIKRRTLWLEKDTVEALMVAGQDMAVSAEVMVLAVVLLSLSRFERWSWVSLSLMQTLRDEVEYRTQDMVAFFSDYRDMGLFPTHSSNSVNDFVFELSTRIRMRKWKAHDYTLYDHSDCLVTDLEGNAVFPVVVNLIPHNSPHYRAGGSDDDDAEKRCRITNVPTYSRMMFQGAGRPSSSPMHVYIEETIPGSEWGLRFQFNEAYFDCHDVVSFVRRSVRGAIRDLTSGAGSAASSQAPHRKWEGLGENTLQ